MFSFNSVLFVNYSVSSLPWAVPRTVNKAISIAELGMKNEVETSILLLNTIMREGVFQKKIFVSLAHELHLAKCYLELMFLRFADVEVKWSLDESLSQCQVFKFSLQPVLENCFSHAFKGSLGRQKMIQNRRFPPTMWGFAIFISVFLIS